MNFDFAAFLVLAVAVSGVIWLIDSLLFAPKRRAAASGEAEEPALPILVEYARSFFPVFLVVLLLRSFLVEPFRIPSGSMMPNLLIGDFILVNKFTYGVRLPVLNNKIIEINAPERGDVVVFRYPKDPSVDYIKRVIGLPGDHIAYIDKTVYINGKPASQELLGNYQGEGVSMNMSGTSLRSEKGDKQQYQILIDLNKATVGGEVWVPEGQYFVMGDNRDNSNDSRFWGTVPEENLVGRAFMIWMNWDSVATTVHWDRLGKAL